MLCFLAPFCFCFGISVGEWTKWISRNYSVDKRMGFLAKVAVVYQGNVSLGWNKWQLCVCDGHWMCCTMPAWLILCVCERERAPVWVCVSRGSLPPGCHSVPSGVSAGKSRLSGERLGGVPAHCHHGKCYLSNHHPSNQGNKSLSTPSISNFTVVLRFPGDHSDTALVFKRLVGTRYVKVESVCDWSKEGWISYAFLRPQLFCKCHVTYLYMWEKWKMSITATTTNLPTNPAQP